MAGLVIDASSPPTSVASTRTNTTAAFTPPSASVLLGLWAGDASTANSPPDPNVADNLTALDWSQDVMDHYSSGSPSCNGQAAIVHALCGSSPGSMTVTVTNGQTSTAGSAWKIYVLTGHNPAGPLGVVGGGRQLSGSSLSASYTGSITGGQGFMVVEDWSANSSATWAAASGCTILNSGTITGEISYAMIQRTNPDGVRGATTTMGLTGLLTAGEYHWAYAEVISLDAANAAAGYPAFGANAPMF